MLNSCVYIVTLLSSPCSPSHQLSLIPHLCFPKGVFTTITLSICTFLKWLYLFLVIWEDLIKLSNSGSWLWTNQLVPSLHCCCSAYWSKCYISFSFTDEAMQKQSDDLGAQFTEQFIQDPEHITLILSLLEVLSTFYSSGESLWFYICLNAAWHIYALMCFIS